MRKALNDNPMVQIGLCAGLLLIVAFLFMTRMGGGDKSPEQQDAAAAAAVALPPGVSSDGAAAPATGAVTAPVPATGVSGATTASGLPSTPSVPSTSGADVTAAALKPGPGLPAPVVDAYKSGDAVVLLIVKPSSVDDQLVEESVESLSRPGIAVFVERADKVARYSRITQGVGVNRVPALVVVRPKSASKGVPEAIVSYGFRDSQSVVQAVEDAVYSGRDDLPYHPG